MTKKEFAAALDSALKAVRKEYGFTQEKMAAVLGISKKTLVEIEKGRSSLGWVRSLLPAEDKAGRGRPEDDGEPMQLI